VKFVLEYEHDNVKIQNGNKTFVVMKMGNGFSYRVCEDGKSCPAWKDTNIKDGGENGNS